LFGVSHLGYEKRQARENKGLQQIIRRNTEHEMRYRPVADWIYEKPPPARRRRLFPIHSVKQRSRDRILALDFGTQN